MTLSEELQWRGFVNQTTISDLRILDKEEDRVFYMGFDASADSQTVGNLAAMMFAKVFMRHNYKAILLAGGSTSLIGDPGGKDKERPLQDEDTIAQNVKKAEEQIRRVMGSKDFKLVNNLDWTKDLKVLPFLRDIGKHFSMTPLIQRDYIATRLGEKGAGISYAEFSYTVLQGLDYLHLYDTEHVTLQLGGSDQWGNCLSGVELIRKTRNTTVDAMTLNLIINKETGSKFGKTEEGAIWLNPTKTSAYKFYQFWLNADDEGVEGYLRIFTELDKQTIEAVMQQFTNDRTARAAQKKLAYEVTKLVHTKEKANTIKQVSDVLFGKGDFRSLGAEEIAILKEELPVTKIDGEYSLEDLLVLSGLASSKTEAVRLVGSGAISLNGQKLMDDMRTNQSERLLNGSNLLKRGKNNFAIVEKI